MLDSIYEVRRAPTASFPNAEILTQRDMPFRLVPGDLELRQEEDGFTDEIVFDEYFSKIGGDCVYWNSFGSIDREMIFIAPYTSRNRQWMMNARFRGNLGITRTNGEFSIVSDIDIPYTIVFATEPILRGFDEAWGGRTKLKRDVQHYLESLPRREDREWALQHLTPLLAAY